MSAHDWGGICFDLRDQPSLIDTLLLWLHAEWLKQRKGSMENPAEAYAKRRLQLREHLGDEAVPMTLIAKECAAIKAPPLGCISLTRLSSRNPRFANGLWVSNLFVTPTARGRGVGESLLKSAEQAAMGLGEKELYLYTDISRGYYTGKGWQECLMPKSNSTAPTVTVFKKAISGADLSSKY